MALNPNSRPAINVRMLSRFPSRIVGATGIDVETAGGIATVKMNVPGLTENNSTTAGDRVMVSYDPASGEHEKIRLDAFAEFLGTQSTEAAEAARDAAEGFRDEAEEFKNQTQDIYDNTVTAGTDAVALITAEGNTQVDRVVAAAQAKIYASVADALSNGVVSVTITAAGSGGTNGAYTVPTTGGGGTQGLARVTVSGGAITAVNSILNKGKGYTSAPTFDLSGITGLTGATLTGVIGQNEPIGRYWGIQSTTPALYDFYVTATVSTATFLGSAPSLDYVQSGYRADGVVGRPLGASMLTGSFGGPFVWMVNKPAGANAQVMHTLEGYNMTASAAAVGVQRRVRTGGNDVKQGSNSIATLPAAIGAFSVPIVPPLVLQPGEYPALVLPFGSVAYVFGTSSETDGCWIYSGVDTASYAEPAFSYNYRQYMRIKYYEIAATVTGSVAKTITDTALLKQKGGTAGTIGRPRNVALVTGSLGSGSVILANTKTTGVRNINAMRFYNTTGVESSWLLQRRLKVGAGYTQVGPSYVFNAPAGTTGEQRVSGLDFTLQPGEELLILIPPSILPAPAGNNDGGYYNVDYATSPATPSSFVSTFHQEMSFEYTEIADGLNAVLDLNSSDKIGFLGQSLFSQSYTLQGKGWLGRLSNSTDWRYVNYSSGGGWLSSTFITNLRANTAQYGTLGPKNYNISHAMLFIDGGDSATGVTLANSLDHISQISEILKAWGAKVTNVSPYYSGTGTGPAWWGGQATAVGKGFADTFAMDFANINPLSRVFGWDTTVGLPAHWLGGHPNIRVDYHLYQGIKRYIDTLGRPREGMKIFRVRPGVSYSTAADLYYKSFQPAEYDRQRFFKELYVGQEALTTGTRNTWDTINSGTTVQVATDEYGVVQGGGTAACTDFALIECILPCTSQHLTGDAILELTGLGAATIVIPDVRAGSVVANAPIGAWGGTIISAAADGSFTIPKEALQNGMRYDKLCILIANSGAFSITGSPRLRYKWDGVEKPKDPPIVDLRVLAKGTELLTTTIFPASGAPTGWTVTGSVTCIAGGIANSDDPIPPIYNVTARGICPVDATNYVSQTITIAADPREDRAAEIRVFARCPKAAFAPASAYPAASPVTEDTFDLAQLFVDIGTASNNPVTVWDAAGLGYQEHVFRTVIPATTTSMKLTIRGSAALHIVGASFKTMDA